jgi:hypothetical protein
MHSHYFEIEPYIGAKPILFGMSEETVVATLGPPLRKSRNFRKELSLDYPLMNVGFDNRGLVCHIGFLPDSEIFFGKLPVFLPESFRELCQLDGSPKEVLGFIVLLSLGIAFTGFHDSDESQRSVTVFPVGHYDALRPKMVDFVAN